MAISFASATGNLFNRLGALGEMLRELRVYQTAIRTDMIDTSSGVVAQLNAEPDLQAIIGSSYLGILTTAESAGTVAEGLAQQILNRMVFNDNPRISQSLTSLNLEDSIKELIRQMNVAGASIQSATVSATVSAFTGTGNGVAVASVLRADGLTQANAFAEDVLLSVTADSYLGGATAGNETITATGEGDQPDQYSFDWPLGSNGSQTFSVIDGNSNNASGNLLNRSGFNNFTTNVPDRWTLATGTAGTHVFEETTILYDGASSLRIAGDGSNLTALTQQFNSSTQTAATLEELTQYAVNLWIRRDGTAAAAGVLTIELIDGGGAVIQDAQGANNSFTVDLTALTTTFVAYNGTFRTPATLPSSQRIRLRLSTALTSGRSVYLDKLSMGVMTKLYTGGPYISVHAGSTNFVQANTDPPTRGDFTTITIANNRGGATNLASFGPTCERFFQLQEKDLLLPSSSSPTISDGLIA